ncbi:hypothetical protein A3D14_00425 [Candidatus Saccharibacteria bacterium RIFCSPHIGHO2_02_FULL_47_12]|nr:MAG: hypothetical protein A3D14_00425 [Candidatus Saccharibacteria bacterium RIFCSPHIGHO2_02_FULL_47_12]
MSNRNKLTFKEKVLAASLATAIGVGAIALGDGEKSKASAQDKDAIEAVQDGVKNLPEDEHVLNVVVQPGDGPWTVVSRVANVVGFEGDILPEVERVAKEPQVTDAEGLIPGEVLQVDLNNL